MNNPGPDEEAIFNVAREIGDPARLSAYLDEACASQPAIRARIERLLGVSTEADGFFQRNSPPALGSAISLSVLGSSAPSNEQPGSVIGRYKLLEKIGEGGCGVVFMAEQEEPVRRRVALKIIKPGMDSKSVIARFEAERQALALMDHPNIAKVLDGGVTGSGESEISNSQSQIHGGRPYFVMELVRGIRITDYCEQHNLSTSERLGLFIQVCQAVQHAHQKGIIHRDLKPSNILVSENDGTPVPKVIDFGIAKATEQKLTDKTLFTQFAQFIGTPAYMSPEQAAMTSLDIDTRSDIYSLGVLLYELLTGTTPFDAQELLKAGFDEMRRIIRETEPERPSTRLTQLLAAANVSSLKPTAGRRATEGDVRADSRRLLPSRETIPLLRGDLDWIVMKCLEKDRNRRYETANGLAADLQRHLSDEPIVAHPPSAAYRLQKTVQRNRGIFAAGIAVLMALVTGLAVAVWQYTQKSKAYQRAQTEAAKSQRVAKFLKDMIHGIEPSVALGRDTALLREIAEQTLEQLAKERDVPPEVEVELRAAVGKVFHALRELSKAEAMHRETLPRMRLILGEAHGQVTDLLLDLACVLEDREKYQESEVVAREALALARKLYGPEHADVAQSLQLLGNSLARQKQIAEAERLMRQALEVRRRIHGLEHPDVASSLCRLAFILSEQGRPKEADPLFREALVMIKKLRGDTHPEVSHVLRNFAYSKFNQKKWGEAEPLYRELLAVQQRLLGNEHRSVAETLGDLAATLVNSGKHAQAEPFAREALAILRKVRGEEHVEVTMAMHNLGMAVSGQGRLDEAEMILRDALALQRKLTPPGSAHLKQTLLNLGRVLMSEQKFAEAEMIMREQVALARATSNSGELLRSLPALAEALYRQEKFDEAETAYRETLQVLQAQAVPDENDIVSTSASLGRLLADWAWAERTNAAGDGRRLTSSSVVPDAKAEANQSLVTSTATRRLNRAHEAERLLRESLAARIKRTDATPWKTSELRSRLGGALVSVAFTDPELTSADQQAKLAEAEELLLDGNEGVQKSRSADRKYKRDALVRLVRFYEERQKPDQVAEWQAKLRTFDEENREFEPVP